MAPSVSYSITVRLEVASRGRAVSEITRAVEQAGGVVTALDVTAGGNERLRVDVTCAARDTARAEAIVAALAGIQDVTVHKVSDRTFLLHLGGKIEMRSKVPLRNRDDLSMAYTPGVGRVALAIAANLGRALTIATPAVVPRLAVLGLGNSGRSRHARHGGKAALFKRSPARRLADLPGQPGHRRDRADRTAHRARVRRHQPGGHQRAAVFRGGAPLRGAARHPGLPPRPARHGHRGDSRADATRCGGGQEAPPGAHRSSLAPRGRAPPSLQLLLRSRRQLASWSPTRAPSTRSRRTSTRACAGSRDTNPHGYAGDLAGALRGRRRVHRAVAPGILSGADIAAMARDAIVFALANPDPEVDPTGHGVCRRVATGAATTRTRSTTCWPSRVSAGC